MDLKRLIGLLVFLVVTAISGYGQEKKVESTKKADPPKELKQTVQKSTKDLVKAVPITDKTNEAMRLRTRKATMQQMHKINTATRKSMTIRRRR